MAAKILHLPDYCELFKESLVEELLFYESLFEYHYGKCSVIGKLCMRDNFWCLQNIALACLDEEYRLQTGAVEILLLPTAYRSNPFDMSSFDNRNMVDGGFYEVHGETVFSNVDDPKLPVKTTHDLVINLRSKNVQTTADSCCNYEEKDISMDSCILDENGVTADLAAFQKTYKPAIQVHTINKIDKPTEVIQCNLQLRLLRNKRRSTNY